MDSEMNKETKEHIERTIELAKSGDPDAGPEYLEHCMNAVLSGTIDEPLRSELFLSLQTLKNLLTNKNTRARVDGLVAEAFLNTKQSGRPSDKFPEWRRQLAACDILLKKKEKSYKQRNEILRRLARSMSPTRRPYDKDLDGIRALYGENSGSRLPQMSDCVLYEMVRDLLDNDPELIPLIYSGQTK